MIAGAQVAAASASGTTPTGSVSDIMAATAAQMEFEALDTLFQGNIAVLEHNIQARNMELGAARMVDNQLISSLGGILGLGAKAFDAGVLSSSSGQQVRELSPDTIQRHLDEFGKERDAFEKRQKEAAEAAKRKKGPTAPPLGAGKKPPVLRGSGVGPREG